MHLLTAFSLKNRALIALVTVVAAVFGFIGVGSLKQELMPSVEFPTIAVVTAYPGASPEVVNNDVSGPVETALRAVPNLESTTATSSTGSSMVLAEFTYGVDLAATEQKVERAISRISQLLPEQSDTQVLTGGIDDFPVIQIAVTPPEGETPEQAAQLVERVAIPDLSDLDGVREAQLTGVREDRVTIEPDPAALAAQGIGEQAITDALQQSGVLVAAGTVEDGERTLAVQAGSTLQSADEIAALPIPRSAEAIAAEQQAILEASQLPGQGFPAADPSAEPLAPATPLTIGDVADVRLEPGPQQSISRVDGAPALTIAVTKVSAANTVEVSHAVQETLDELQDQLDGATLTVIFDQAPYIEESIHTLTTEGLLGLVFAVLVILVFLLSVRATLVTAISIPTSVLLTFVGLNFAEYSLNLLTLGALTISIGRVVDDSIVVIENIKRHMADGGDRMRTIIEAVREVAGAITASTITTVAVFLPMAFVEGMVGELFRPFAFTVTIALAASLFVSLTIVPVLAYWFLRGDRPKRRATAVGPQAERATALQRGYRPIIEWTLRRPAVTMLIAVLVFGATIAAASSPLMKTNFLGADEQNSVGLVQTLEPGTSLDAQLAQAERVEEALAGVPAVETVQVTIGSAGGGMSALFGGGGDGSVSYSLTTDPDADQAVVQDDIRTAVDALDDAGEFSLGQSGGGVAMSSAIEVNVSAPDQETLREASEIVTAELRESPELQQVESDLAQSRPYLRVTVDRTAAAAAGLTEAGVAGQLAQQMQPRQIGRITMDADSVDVYLASGVAPDDQAGVAALQIQTALGPQRLDALAEIEVADGPVTVRTEDGARMVTVSALPGDDDLGTAGAAVDAVIESVELPAGATAGVGGVLAQQGEAFQQLGLALLAAILIVYVVMVATFRSLLQPLLLLVSVPFAATGAILLLIATGIPLGVASLIGVLMLIGIVVTNAIVLIDLVNQYRDRGDALRDAVLHGSLQRLRPIVMTALATIFALTPMALGITGKGGFISQPLAVVVIGGLLSSTALTLIVLPTLYYVVERRREGGARRRRARRRGSSPSGGGAAAAVDAGAVSGAGAAAGAGAGSVETAGAAAAAGGAGSTEASEPEFAVASEDGGAPLGDRVPGVEASSDPESVPAHAPESVPVPDSEPAPVPEPMATPAPVPAVADEATRQAILEELLRAGLSAPEISGESAGGPGSAPAQHARAHDAPEGAAHAEPEAASQTEYDEAGPETAQMSLALADLGFTGAENPLSDVADEALREEAEPLRGEAEALSEEAEPLSEEAEPLPEAVAETGSVPLVLPEPVQAHTAADDPRAAADPESGDEALSEPGAVPQAESGAEPDPAHGDAAYRREDPIAPPPVTGELDWEQLMWQATQEIDDEDDEHGESARGADDGDGSVEDSGASESTTGRGE
ncbi:efflux RND transporter permease subunit [Leucobacter triazinivorans]|uniref:AcrB/AcrD/AcrF family protein n=1 Tax=Leucobacter triazinivorans TaxID=1784719 RepID=A0A4P6KIX2_9MICO|nr:efflux RND transporter permease subunit [Leucobacter triazinivorans]QBE49544.1 AcrB/AcrD/AcrF family protein [Leucobacter triazinivorans]